MCAVFESSMHFHALNIVHLYAFLVQVNDMLVANIQIQHPLKIGL